jgi:hypothetical protein
MTKAKSSGAKGAAGAGAGFKYSSHKAEQTEQSRFNWTK